MRPKLTYIFLTLALSSSPAFSAVESTARVSQDLTALYPGYSAKASTHVSGSSVMGQIITYEPRGASDVELAERAINYCRVLFTETDATAAIIMFYDSSNKRNFAVVRINTESLQSATKHNGKGGKLPLVTRHYADGRFASDAERAEQAKNAELAAKAEQAARAEAAAKLRLLKEKEAQAAQAAERLQRERLAEAREHRRGESNEKHAQGPMQIQIIEKASDQGRDQTTTSAQSQSQSAALTHSSLAERTGATESLGATTKARVESYVGAVADGPLQSSRANMLMTIEALKSHGKDVSACMSSFASMEQLVRSGADVARVSASLLKTQNLVTAVTAGKHSI